MLIRPCAAPAQQVVVIGTDLEPTTTTLDAVSLSDPALLRLQISADPSLPQNDKQYVARLVDGQVFVGTLFGAGKDGESIRLALDDQQREVVLSLDELVSFTRVGQQLKRETNDDTILLVTGETLAGFVDAIGQDSVGFVVGDADEPIQIPMERVLGFSIANKPEPVKAEKGLARVQLRGGTSLLLHDALLKQATAQTPATLEGSLELDGKSTLISMPLKEVLYIEPLSGKHTLQRLADNEMTIVEGGEVFGVSMPPRINADASISLHAPVQVGFALPKGARRLVFDAALDLNQDIAQSRRALAGCELVVYDGDTVIGGCTLKPDEPAQRLNVELPTGKLRIEVKPGVNGAVLDRVRLSNAEVLVGE